MRPNGKTSPCAAPGVRGPARETGAHGIRARFRGASLRRGGCPHGSHDRRGARLPDRREFQPEHHLHAPRQRHRLRRARKGASRPRGQPHHGQGGEGCRGKSRDAARNASGHEGHRLVHRGVRRRAGLDEHHRHLPDAAPRGFRRGVPQGRRPRRARHGDRNRGAGSETGFGRSRQILPPQAASLDGVAEEEIVRHRRQVDGIGRPEAVRSCREGDRVPA